MVEVLLKHDPIGASLARAAGGWADHHPHSVLTLKQSAAETDTT